jgi:hypothetical protein
MRHRLTIPMLLAGALLVAGACGTEREPTAPTAPPAPSFSNNVSQPDLEDQIERLIPQLFPRPRLALAAFLQFEAIEFYVKKGKTASAKKLALDLVAFTFDKYNKHLLNGDQTPQTQQRLQSFIDLLFRFVGLGHAPIPPGALGPDGAVAIVGPSGGQVVTETQLAGTDIPSGALPQTVIVTISRADNQLNPLPTNLPQFPVFYEFKTFPEVPQFSVPVTVAVCVLDTALLEGVDPANLRIAHQLHSDPTAIEILPRVEQSLVPGACDEGLPTRKGLLNNLASAGKSVANDLFWLAMGAPKDLSATERTRTMMPGGLGGRTGSFSTFGAVDFNGTLVPYQDTGYRYLQLGAGVGSPGDFASLNFNDSDWLIGPAAFGTGSCPLSGTIHTAWPVASPSVVTNPAQFTSILLRKTFEVPAGVGGVTVGVAVDNDVQVFVNGVNITASPDTDATGFLRHEDCPTLDSFILTVPDSVLHAGTNLVVVRARDRGVQSFIDIRVKGVLSDE